MNTIVAEGLSKKYDTVEALKNADLSIGEGEIFGLIGPDGAGKTTLIRILTTLILPDSGTAQVAGMDVVRDYKKLRGRIGYMPGKFSLYGDLTVRENLDLFASVFNTTTEDNYHLIKDIYVRLEPFAERRASKLSGGMKQKLALCCALIHSPKVLFLDEPTTGVDPSSRYEFWEILGRLKEQGITILASTAYMEEASKCDRIALIRNGRILLTDTPDNIAASFDKHLYEVRSGDMFSLLRELRHIDWIERCYTFGDTHHIVSSDAELEAKLMSMFSDKSDSFEVRKIKATVEDCYLNLHD